MEFAFWPAVFAGLVGGLIMAGMRMTMKAAGMDLKMDVARMWGTMMKVYGTAGQLLGMMIHLLVSALIALRHRQGNWAPQGRPCDTEPGAIRQRSGQGGRAQMVASRKDPHPWPLPLPPPAISATASRPRSSVIVCGSTSACRSATAKSSW